MGEVLPLLLRSLEGREVSEHKYNYRQPPSVTTAPVAEVEAAATARWEKWRLRLHMSAPRLKLSCASLHLGGLALLGCASCRGGG